MLWQLKQNFERAHIVGMNFQLLVVKNYIQYVKIIANFNDFGYCTQEKRDIHKIS